MPQPLTLLHYSKEPLDRIWSVPSPEADAHYQQTGQRYASHKPRGLWVTVKEGNRTWPEFCFSIKLREKNLQYGQEIVPKPNANILLISTEAEMHAFSAEYGEWERTSLGRPSCDRIFWGRVAEKYNGIVIDKYFHDLRIRNETFWYYEWDCASGCIWNADVIEEVKPHPGARTCPKVFRSWAEGDGTDEDFDWSCDEAWNEFRDKLLARKARLEPKEPLVLSADGEGYDIPF